MLSEIVLRRLHCWINPPRPQNVLQAKALEFEWGQLGFTLQNRAAFTAMTRREFEIATRVLQAMRGGDVSYVPLFARFPDDLPNDDEYLLRRILGFWGLNTFLDDSRFGADPIGQQQRQDLWQAAAAAQRQRLVDTHVEWIAIALISPEVGEQRLTAWATDLIYGATPVKEALWDDLFTVLSQLNLDIQLERIRIKETLARLAAQHWQQRQEILVRTPTDLLRLFAFLQDQDVALAQPVDLTGLKLSKPQRRTVIRFLNTCPALAEDLLRYRGLWLSLSRWLHPGDFAKAYPAVARAFDDLRNNRIQSFESQVVNAPLGDRLAILNARPAVLLRKLTWLLQDCPPETVAASVLQLGDRLDTLPLPLLVTAYCAVRYTGDRTAINKQGKPHTIPKRQPLGDVSAVLAALETLILAKLAGNKPWHKVWLDPALDKLVLPLQARQQADGLLNLGRGSRLPLAQEIVRLFIYWQEGEQRTDLDLSLLKLDAQFGFDDYIAWNHYGSDPNIAHSGDIQSAPFGAAEFVDVRLSAFQHGYILPAVIRYAGDRFADLKACHAGWMYRQQVGAKTQSFDAKTVAEKVDVCQNGRLWLPFLVDLAARELVYVDLYAQGRNMVENNPHFPALAKAIAADWQAKPTFGRLARWYVQANNASLVSRHAAETTIGTTDDCTINIFKLVGQGVTSF